MDEDYRDVMAKEDRLTELEKELSGKQVCSSVGVIWPAQCSCEHLYLEKYQFNELTKEGAIGFVERFKNVT